MENLIKILILVVAIVTTVFFLVIDYDIWKSYFTGNLFEEDQRFLIQSIFTIAASFFSIPAIKFWFKLILFNEPIIFKPPTENSSSIFLKQFINQARLAFIYSIVLLISVISIILSAIFFNSGLTAINYLRCLLFSVPFILIFIVSRKTFNNIKSLQ